MKTLKAYRALVWKDIQVEFRGKQVLLASLAFGVLLLFIMGIALDADTHLPADWSAGMLWMNVFFATSVGMTRHDVRDREFGALFGSLIGPFDRSLLFYAKWTTTSVFVGLGSIVMAGAFFIILNQPLPHHLGVFLGTYFGGTVVLTGVGTFLAGMSAPSTMRDVLLPILLFPVGIPLFLAVIRLTEYTFQAKAPFPSVWLEVLVGYFVIFAVLPWLLYETVLEV